MSVEPRGWEAKKRAPRCLWARAALLVVVTVGIGLGARPASASTGRLVLHWPTSGQAWHEGRSSASFLQHAGSGDPASGGFGGVRSGGSQFHEGIDIRAERRDRSGAPTDSVHAVMDGVVRHVSSVAGDSSYGRYIVIEHTDASPAVYSLYAHLARIAPGLRRGDRVGGGHVLGVVGHSSGGYMIPKDRAHLHFELGVMMSRNFQSWYDRQKFGSPNEHNLWNGMNLVGFDPLDFFKAWRAGRIHSVADYFGQMEPAVKVRIATTRVPDFVSRYPALLTRPLPAGPVAGWEVAFSWTGVPFAWTWLDSAEVRSLETNRPVIVMVGAAVKRERSKSLAVSRRGNWHPGKDLETALELLFDLRL